MSTVINVENLSKKYIIGHQKKAGHTTLRDAIASGAKNLGSKLLSPISRNSSPVSDPTHEEFWALKDVSFDIRQGDRVGIIGRNGAGKSTLLKILSRITEPTSGRVSINGRVASLLEVGTGFHPELSGRENIFLNGAILGMSKAEIKSKFDEIVAFSEVEKFLDTPVKRYSSGMYVRLAFAVAAHLEPEILIVDEVLAVGDMSFQKKCMGKMEDVGKEGRTVLFVSHNIGMINNLCSSAILLDKGKLITNGATYDTIKSYLSKNTGGSNCYSLESNPAKAMNLRRVSLNPDKNEATSDVRYDEPIVIRVEYEVNAPISNATVWIGLQTMEGVRVFNTADHDLKPEMLGRRVPGYYMTDVLIPEKWLNIGEYNVIVGVVENNPLVVHNREETITFNVSDVGSPGSIFKENTRNGVLQPYLEWRNVD